MVAFGDQTVQKGFRSNHKFCFAPKWETNRKDIKKERNLSSTQGWHVHKTAPLYHHRQNHEKNVSPMMDLPIRGYFFLGYFSFVYFANCHGKCFL
jgi:hypothetical protein